MSGRLRSGAVLVLGALLAASAARAGVGPSRSGRRLLSLPTTEAVTLLPPAGLARRRHPYGWPLRPFGRAHAVRGGFGDPRFGAKERNFHFGIDLPAAGGTPVYAVAAGTVYLEQDHVDVLAGQRESRLSGFSYWHIVPAVREHVRVGLHALLGWVKPAWGHLHFSEIEHGRFVNPLRPGALTPAPPPFTPVIDSVAISPAVGGTADDGSYSGRIAVVVDAYARPPLPLQAPWQSAVVAPSLIRWRLLATGAPVSTWQTAVDFRTYIPSDSRYHDVYAPGTLSDRPDRPGTYLFYMARDWNLDTLAPGAYTIEVEAFGTRGATALASAPFAVAG